MTNTVTIEVPFDSEVPDIAGCEWVADVFGITRTAVSHAIRDGRLPARKVSGAWLINPADAALIWGYRLVRRETNN